MGELGYVKPLPDWLKMSVIKEQAESLPLFMVISDPTKELIIDWENQTGMFYVDKTIELNDTSRS